MKIRYNLDLVLLYIIVIINISFFSLIELSDDIILICNLLFIVYIELKYYKKETHSSNRFKYIILFSVVLIITSAYQSLKLYNQSFWLGIRPQRHFFVALLMYFPLNKLLGLNKISKDDIIKMIYRIALIQLIVQIAYYISGGSLSFIKLNHDYRYGEIRLRADSCLINLFFVITVTNFLKGKNRVKNFIYTVINLVYVMFMLKTRLLMLSYFGVLVVAFIIWKRDVALKILFSFIVVGIIPAILNTEIFQNTIEDIFEDNPDDIRAIGKAYYREQLKESPILGRGYINTDWEPAYNGAGMNRKIYLNDNGLIGFTFVFGILGLIWFLIWYILLIKNRISSNEKRKRLYVFFILHTYWYFIA